MAEEADMVTPGDQDKKTRTALPAGDKPPVTDPEAPYGWMTDPKTGERRPKKRPGKQAKSQPAPPNRPANKTREASPGSTSTADYSGQIYELVNGVWMLTASIPTLDQRFLGYDLRPVSVKIKAQAAIIRDNGPAVIKGLNLMAQNNETVRRGVEKMGSDNGPMWVLPAMFALLPFVAQSAAMWRAPTAGDVELLAKRTEAEWDEFVGAAMREAAAEAQAAEKASHDDTTAG